jgi:hypothetical protein
VTSEAQLVLILCNINICEEIMYPSEEEMSISIRNEEEIKWLK